MVKLPPSVPSPTPAPAPSSDVATLWAKVENLPLDAATAARGLEQATAASIELPVAAREALAMASSRGVTGGATPELGDVGASQASSAQKKRLEAALKELHREVAAEIKGKQLELGLLQTRLATLLGDAPNPEALPPEARAEYDALQDDIRQVTEEKGEFGQLGRLLTSMRGEGMLDRLGVFIHTGVGVSVPGVAFGGAFFIPNIPPKDPETGERAITTNVSLGVATPMVGGGKVLGKPGYNRTFSLLPYVSASRDLLMGDVLSVSVPGAFYAGIYKRGDTAGFQLGFFPLSVQLGGAIEHPFLARPIGLLMRPSIKVVTTVENTVRRALQKIGDAIRSLWKPEATAPQTAEPERSS